MKREDVMKQLKEWESTNELFSQKSSGLNSYKIYSMIAKKECYQTDKSFLYANTEEVCDKFNELFRSGYIMSLYSAMERYPQYTRTRFDRACAEGFALKTRICGVLLYIRGDEDMNVAAT